MRPVFADACGHVERGGYLNKSRTLSISKKGKWIWSRKSTLLFMSNFIHPFPHIQSKKMSLPM